MSTATQMAEQISGYISLRDEMIAAGVKMTDKNDVPPTQKAVPVRHTNCGNIVMWYMGERGDNNFSSANIVYLDGTCPVPYSAVRLCPFCHGRMGGSLGGSNLIRCFDEDVHPGFDVHEAWENGKRTRLAADEIVGSMAAKYNALLDAFESQIAKGALANTVEDDAPKN